MKHNYLLYGILFSTIIFRSSLINMTGSLFIKNSSIELKLLKDKNDYLVNQYNSLLDFKNNIDMKYDYTITNVIKTNYGFGSLQITGTNYNIGSEVVNEEGLVGIISKINGSNSNIKYLYDTNLVVKINEESGKISDKDSNNNLIIKEISNYNNIKINDLVYSINGTYIGKIIKIKYDILDNYLTVKTVKLDNINYVAVINR